MYDKIKLNSLDADSYLNKGNDLYIMNRKYMLLKLK